MSDLAPRRGRTLKLYLVEGTSTGVITAELGVSSVRAVVASRTALPELLKRDEAARTGIYVLVGPDPALPERQLAYVGEGDQVRTRLQAHDSDSTKDFFNRVVLVISKDENLTKAHGRYLESRLLKAISVANRAKLVNGTEPDFKGLPEAEVADMERVLDEIEVLLPILGFDILRPAGREASTSKGIFNETAKAEFIFTESGTNARAIESNDEFVILKGSLARSTETQSCPSSTHRRREQLLTDGLLSPTEDGFLRFTSDIAFDSPSGAGSVVYGGSVNGRTYWRHESTGLSYALWRQSQLRSGETPTV